jgi:hypothetical protein
MRRIGLLLGLLALVLTGCATTSAVMMDSAKVYPATTDVQILQQVPDKPYTQIAVLESRGAVGTSLPDLLQSMQKKAEEIGADAIIPTQNASEQSPQGIIYNPWLGGYQTLGGGRIPVIRGIAIKYK